MSNVMNELKVEFVNPFVRKPFLRLGVLLTQKRITI